MAVSAAVGVAAVVGGAMSYESSANAANTMAGAANNASNLTAAEFAQQQANEAPWLASGKAALGTLNADMPDLTRSFTGADFQQDPGYQFDLQQGQQAMQRSAAAKGLLNSVGTQQNLNNYSQNMASNEYGNAYNRFTSAQAQKYNMLSGMAGQGQVAAQQINTAGGNAATQIGNNIMGAGNAQGAAQIAGGNAINGTIGQGVNSFANQQLLSQLTNGGSLNSGVNQGLYGATSGANQAMASNMPAYSMPGMGASAPQVSYLSDIN